LRQRLDDRANNQIDGREGLRRWLEDRCSDLSNRLDHGRHNRNRYLGQGLRYRRERLCRWRDDRFGSALSNQGNGGRDSRGRYPGGGLRHRREHLRGWFESRCSDLINRRNGGGHTRNRGRLRWLLGSCNWLG
jgi:hypothetical protein